MSDIHTLTETEIITALKTIYDPEIPVNIYELGLIYDIRIETDNKLNIAMTLTSPNCPEAQSLPLQVERRLRQLPDVKDVTVRVVWDPPWNPNMMSEAARLEMGFM
jgi:FeS assembly SUF system protein